MQFLCLTDNDNIILYLKCKKLELDYYVCFINNLIILYVFDAVADKSIGLKTHSIVTIGLSYEMRNPSRYKVKCNLLMFSH